jgi:hypothetical protein
MIWMTCVLDGREHGVSDEAVAAGADHGRYRAVCGRVIVPASLTCPPGRRCPGCEAALGVLPTRPRPVRADWRTVLRTAVRRRLD